MKNKGITLIALVITIIILLILVAVSVATLTGENGIIIKAREAREVTEIAEVIERAKTDILGIQAENNGKITKAQLQIILTKYFNDVPETLPEDLSTLVLITKDEYGKHEIEISKIYNGTTRAESNKPILISARDIANGTDKSEYYGATVTGYTCTNSAGVNAWKIFYADSSNIYLIADDYISSTYAPKGKGESSLNQGDTDYNLYFTDVISDYNGSADITDSKIKALNNDYFNVKGYSSTNNNMKAVAYMLDTNVWSVFAGSKAEYAIGGPTIEMLMKSYSQKYNVDYRAQASSSTGYLISKDGGANWVGLAEGLLDARDSLYAMNRAEGPEAMWLASPCADTPDSMLTAGLIVQNGYIYFPFCSDSRVGFRPLVCLNSNVQLEKRSDGTYAIK